MFFHFKTKLNGPPHDLLPSTIRLRKYGQTRVFQETDHRSFKVMVSWFEYLNLRPFKLALKT